MTNKRLVRISTLALAVSASFGISAEALAARGSYIIMGAGDQLPAGIERKVSRAGGSIERLVPGIGMAVVSSDQANFAAKAARIPGVSEVLPNLTVQWVRQPAENVALEDYGNPPFSGDDDFFFDLQWGHDAVDAPEAWNMGYSGEGVQVAVLDGGFDLDHPDLAPNINLALSADFTGEGLQYGLSGPFSHGTHVAGTIAAADNGFGVIGVAPAAELVLVKVLGDAGSGSFADVIAGIVHAADAGVDVINMSLGALLPRHGFCEDDGEGGQVCYNGSAIAGLVNATNKATTYAYQRGVTVIASAGNEGIDGNKDKDLLHIPSDGPNVISISATAPVGWATDPANANLDFLASYSNYGKSVISFGAPGGDVAYPGNEGCVVAGLARPCWVFDLVFSTGNGGWYWSAGTSMAAPHAAGVAAIIIGKNGGAMHPAQVAAEMRRSADDLGKPGKDAYYGAGRVNAYNAVK